jgi:hypothetical protein
MARAGEEAEIHEPADIGQPEADYWASPTLNNDRSSRFLLTPVKPYASRQDRASIAGSNFKAPADLPKTHLHSEYSETNFPRTV